MQVKVCVRGEWDLHQWKVEVVVAPLKCSAPTNDDKFLGLVTCFPPTS